MTPNVIFPAKLFQRGDKTFYLNNITSGFLYPIMNYVSTGFQDKKLFFLTEDDDIIKLSDISSLTKDNFKGDFIDFKYEIKNVVREKPKFRVEDDYIFSWQPTHFVYIKENALIARLGNGDLYRIYFAKHLPKDILDLAKNKKDVIIGKLERMVAIKIKNDIVYLAQTFDGYKTIDFFSKNFLVIKMGDGTAPFIKAPFIFDDYYMLSPFKTGLNLYALCIKKSNKILYLVDTTTNKTFNLSELKSPIVDLIQKNKNVVTALLKNGDLVELDFNNHNSKKIQSGVEAVGMYWFNNIGIAPSCMKRCRVEAQRNYIKLCQGNNVGECNKNSVWAGVGVNSEKYSVYNKTISLSSNIYSYRLETTGDYNFAYKMGVAIYKKNGEWLSLSPNFQTYKADGKSVKSDCGQKDNDILETIQIYDFYTSNQHKNKLLYTASLQGVGDFEKDMSAGFVPVRISREVSEIKLPF